MHTNPDTMNSGCMDSILQLHTFSTVTNRGRAQFHKEFSRPKKNDGAASHDGSAAADSTVVLPRGRGYVIESRWGDDDLNSITVALSN